MAPTRPATVSQDQILRDREARTRAVEQARAIHDLAHAEDRDLTPEESQQIEGHLAEAERIRAHYDREERLRALAATQTARRLTEPDELDRPLARSGSLIDDVYDEDALLQRGQATLEELFGSRATTLEGVVSARRAGVLPDQAQRSRAAAGVPWTRSEMLRATDEYREAWARRLVTPESLTSRQQQLIGEVHADLQVDHDTQAGVLVMPLQTVEQIIAAADQLVTMRQFATVIPVRGAKALGVRKRTAKASTYARGTELAAPGYDAALAYGAKELHPHDWSAGIKVSRNLIAQSALSVESVVINELMIDIREAQGAEFALGDGDDAPLGVFVASADGISTSRDFDADNTTTAVTLVGIKGARWGLARYASQGLRWGGNQALFEQIDKLETGPSGELIWRTNVREGEPDMLLGLPYFVDETFPSTFTAGLYVGMLAAWQWYWIAVSLDMTIQRLQELYAEANQIGFIVRGKDDAMPVLEEPFGRIKLAD